MALLVDEDTIKKLAERKRKMSARRFLLGLWMFVANLKRYKIVHENYGNIYQTLNSQITTYYVHKNVCVFLFVESTLYFLTSYQKFKWCKCFFNNEWFFLNKPHSEIHIKCPSFKKLFIRSRSIVIVIKYLLALSQRSNGAIKLLVILQIVILQTHHRFIKTVTNYSRALNL